jgi:hypothetical protein
MLTVIMLNVIYAGWLGVPNNPIMLSVVMTPFSLTMTTFFFQGNFINAPK